MAELYLYVMVKRPITPCRSNPFVNCIFDGKVVSPNIAQVLLIVTFIRD